MANIWESCTKKIQEEVSLQAFERWFSGIEEVEASESSLTIRAPDPFTANTLRTRYWGIITDVLREEAGREVDLHLLVKKNGSAPTNGVVERPQATEAPPSPPERPDFLNPKYRFDNFVIGGANEFAHACSLRVAQGLGIAHNPLFIYGGVGLGKTHLLHAIAHQIVDTMPKTRVVYTSSESFINELIASIRRDRMSAFRSKYRKADVLMIDDVQFIAGKERTQEEFFFTFNSLHENRKQIVITSDKVPHDIVGLEDRLRSRFQSGMMADIGAPDFETKVAILQKKAGEEGFSLDRDVAHYIAEKVRSNVRELEGCLIKLYIHASLRGNGDIDLPVAQEVLRDVIRDRSRHSSVDHIQRIVAEHFQIRLTDLKSKNRSRCFAVPRQIAMFLARQITNASTTEIGLRFGGKDHSTVIHSTKKIEGLLKTDSALASTIHTLRQKIDMS